jgi:hypothetical protein
MSSNSNATKIEELVNILSMVLNLEEYELVASLKALIVHDHEQ